MKEFLSSNGIAFYYIDITGSMLNLKKFLKIRDNRPEYTDIKAAGRVGIPCVEVEDQLFLREEDIDLAWIRGEGADEENA